MQGFFEHDGSTLVCARRATSASTATAAASPSSDSHCGGESAETNSRDEEERFLSSADVAPWRAYVEMVDLAEGRVMDVSSTKVREAVKAGDWDRVNEMVPVSGVRDIIKREKLYL